MRNNRFKFLQRVFFTGFILVAGCGGGGGGGTGPTGPAAFSLTSPENGSAGLSATPTFMWSDSSDETSFTLQIASDSTFNSIVYEINLSANTTSYALPPARLHVGTSYAWRVKASNSAGETYAANAPWTFTTASTAPAAFSLTSPADNALDVSLTPTLTWTDSIGADAYQIQIADNQAFSSPQTSTTITAAASPGYTVVTALTERTLYYWKVTAINTVGSTVAGPYQFETKSANAPDINLISPINNAMFVEPILSWAGSRADEYLVLVATDSGFSSLAYQKTVSSLVTELTLTNLTEAAWYFWKVRATNDAGSATSETWSFETKTESGKPTAPILTFPTNTTGVLLPPTLTWQDASGEDNYFLEIGTDNPISTVTVTASLSKDLESYQLSPTALTPGTEYFWHVLASNTTGTTESGIFSFTTISSGANVWAQTNNPNGADAEVYAIAADADNIYLAGYNSAASSVNDQWRIEKRKISDGSLVNGFGSNGVVVTNPTSSWDYISGMTLTGTSLIAVGIDVNDGWRIEKRNVSDGQLDATFGVGAAVYSSPTWTYDVALAVAKDASSLYIAGYSSDDSGNEIWKIEKRDISTGALVSGFGNSGVVQSTTGTGFNEAKAIAIDSANNAMYIVGYDNVSGINEWRIEKRTLDTGAPVLAFDADGVVNSVSGEANAVATHGNYLYVAGESSSGGTTAIRIEKIDLADGSLITSVTSSIDGPDSGNDSLYAISLDSPNFYVSGYSMIVSGNYQWYVEKRSLDTLAKVTSFGSNGVAISNPSSGDDTARAMTLDPVNPYIYVAGYETNSGYFEWRVEKIVK